MGKGEGWGEGQGEGCGQGHGAGAGAEDWQHGTCGCMDDCGNCLCGTCCFFCQTYQNAEKMGKSGILYGLLACVAPCIPLIIMRGDLRDQHGIEGSTMGDALASICCGCCVSVQIANELDSRK